MFYHEYEISDGNNISAACNFCVGKNRKIKGKVNVTSNFVTHLKCHQEQYQKFLSLKKSTSRKRQTEPSEVCPSTSKKVNVTDKKSAQERADNLVSDFIVKLGLPLNTLNHEATKSLVRGLSAIPFEVDCISSYKLKGINYKRVIIIVKVIIYVYICL